MKRTYQPSKIKELENMVLVKNENQRWKNFWLEDDQEEENL